MARAVILCCCFYFISLSPMVTSALTDEQKATIKEHFEKIGAECIGEHTITEDDINNLKSKKIADGPNVPCFLACMLKKVGVIDDKGFLSKETALDLAKTHFKEPEELKLIESYLHSCAHVNTEAVSDGDKGCERAAKSYKCMLENRSQFGFDL